jgi:hypothetical protein
LTFRKIGLPEPNPVKFWLTRTEIVIQVVMNPMSFDFWRVPVLKNCTLRRTAVHGGGRTLRHQDFRSVGSCCALSFSLRV